MSFVETITIVQDRSEQISQYAKEDLSKDLEYLQSLPSSIMDVENAVERVLNAFFPKPINDFWIWYVPLIFWDSDIGNILMKARQHVYSVDMLKSVTDIAEREDFLQSRMNRNIIRDQYLYPGALRPVKVGARFMLTQKDIDFLEVQAGIKKEVTK